MVIFIKLNICVGPLKQGGKGMAVIVQGVNKNKKKIELLEAARNKKYIEALETYSKEKKHWKKRNPFFISIFSLSAIVIFLIGFGVWFLIPLISLISLIIIYILKPSKPSEILFSILSKEERILKSGIEGEERALDVLKNLSDDYIIFTNIEVLGYEIDFTVLGPTGLFIIENKHLKGIIEGDVEDKKWIRKKISSSGEIYSDSIDNPILQVTLHKDKLQKYFRKNNFIQQIESIIFFSSGDIKLTIQNNLHQLIFDNNQELIEYIEKGNNFITKEKIKRLKDLITSLVKIDSEIAVQRNTGIKQKEESFNLDMEIPPYI